MNSNIRNFTFSVIGAVLLGIALFSSVYIGIQASGPSLGSIIVLFILGGGTFSLIMSAWVKFLHDKNHNLSNTERDALRYYRTKWEHAMRTLKERKIQLEVIHSMMSQAVCILLGKTKFIIGAPVHKRKGYKFEGTIQSVFVTASGDLRYVVENGHSVGMLHIFNEEQLGHGTYANAVLEDHKNDEQADEQLIHQLETELQLTE